MITEAKARAIVQEYTGEEPVEVQLAPDPKVPTCTAIRATLAQGHVLGLIVHQHTTGYDVEEVEFKSWPPRGI